MAEFTHLLMRICSILSESPNEKDNLKACKRFCCLLKVSDSTKELLFSAQEKSEINGCKNFEELFDIVNRCISWDEHSVLREIIDVCESVEATEEFYQYMKKMALAKGLEIISSAESDPPPGFEKFYVIINESYKKLTYNQYEEVKKFIFENLNVSRYVTTGYIRVLFGSLHLEWHVTKQASPYMKEMANKQRKVFEKRSYVFMQIGKEIIFDFRTSVS